MKKLILLLLTLLPLSVSGQGLAIRSDNGFGTNTYLKNPTLSGGNLNGATNYNSSNLVGTVWGGISNAASGGTNMFLVGDDVGIGTPVPAAKLDVSGDLRVAGVGKIFGNLGVGGIPTTLFHAIANSAAPGDNAIKLDYGGVNIFSVASVGGGGNLDRARMDLLDSGVLKILFVTSGDSYIDGPGNFGVGTTTPTSGRLVVDGGGITFGTDNTYDFGASGANRSRTGYFGTSVVVPTITLANNPTLSTTNVAPAGFVIGVTVPVTWFVFTNNGTRFLIPGYTP